MVNLSCIIVIVSPIDVMVIRTGNVFPVTVLTTLNTSKGAGCPLGVQETIAGAGAGTVNPDSKGRV
jgi:hypothetical protein